MKRFAWHEVHALSPFVEDDAVPREHDTRMRGAAQRCSYRRCVMLRPFPARLMRGASKTYAGYMNDLKAAKRERTHFISRIKFLED